jgi:nitrate/nitrite transport system ATP-binding protein
MTKSTSFSDKTNSRTVNGAGFLEIENIVKSYPNPEGGELVVLDNINLSIASMMNISL